MDKQSNLHLHMFMQAKGGVGKSFCACMLAQYLRNKGSALTVYDSDPSNASLCAFSGLRAVYVDVLQNEQTVAVGGLDRMVEFLDPVVLSSIPDQVYNVILDIGASNFIPTVSYLTQNRAFDYFQAQGFEVFVHMPIVGGDPFFDCISCFSDLTQKMPHAKFILWINNYPVRVFKGKRTFEELLEYQENQDKVFGIINLPQFEESTFGKTLKYFLDANKLFTEADDVQVGGKSLTAFDKFRAKCVADEIFSAISVIDAYL